jgi:hypothetical protein
MRDGGNQWSAWCSYLSWFRLAGLDIDYSKWIHYENAAIYGGPRYMHAKFCIVSDRPRILRVDDLNRPHSSLGPSHEWADGVRLYYWHGVKVEEAWIERPQDVDVSKVFTEANNEKRAALAQIVGWDRVLSVYRPRTIDKDAEHIGELLEVDLPDAPGSRFLRVIGPGNAGPRGAYVLGVPREMRTAREANGWTYGDNTYKPGVRT